MKLTKTEWAVLAGLLLLSLVPCIGGVFRLIELGTASAFLPDNPRMQLDSAPFVYHIISSVIYCIVGIFQFLPSVRKTHPRWHRIAGRSLVVFGVVSAVSGVWMTHYYDFPESLQGNLLYVVRFIVGFSMVAFILLGVNAVLKKQIVQHQAWMIRAYGLAQGAGTQVLLALAWYLIIGGEATGPARDMMMTAAWVINLLIAEMVISRSGKIASMTTVKQ